MSNFIGDNINAIRIHKGLSQEQFASAAGVSQTTVSAWECGTSTPRKSNVMKLVEAIHGLEFDDVMSEENGFAKRVLKKCDAKSFEGFRMVPLYGSIAAGTPIEMVQVDDEHPIPGPMADRYPDAFLLKISGDSMDRVLPNGCYALVDPCDEITKDGEPYAVCVNGFDATVKRVRRLANGFQLIPDSTDPTYAVQTFNFNEPDTQTITVIGRVVWYVIPFDWSF